MTLVFTVRLLARLLLGITELVCFPLVLSLYVVMVRHSALSYQCLVEGRCGVFRFSQPIASCPI